MLHFERDLQAILFPGYCFQLYQRLAPVSTADVAIWQEIAYNEPDNRIGNICNTVLPIESAIMLVTDPSEVLQAAAAGVLHDLKCHCGCCRRRARSHPGKTERIR
jgi:hypothetical protein